MKNLLAKSAYLIIFAIIFSGCGGNTQTVSNSSNTTANTEAKKSDYPLFPSSVGDVEFKLVDGSNFKIADNKGKVILLNLWATWCGPCRAEMPHLIELQEQNKDKNFEVLGLSIGDNETGEPESEEDIKKFAEKMGLNYKLGRIDRKVYTELLKISKFEGIPQTYLINREGQLAGIFTGGNTSTFAKMKQFTEKAINE